MTRRKQYQIAARPVKKYVDYITDGFNGAEYSNALTVDVPGRQERGNFTLTQVNPIVPATPNSNNRHIFSNIGVNNTDTGRTGRRIYVTSIGVAGSARMFIDQAYIDSVKAATYTVGERYEPVDIWMTFVYDKSNNNATNGYDITKVRETWDILASAGATNPLGYTPHALARNMDNLNQYQVLKHFRIRLKPTATDQINGQPVIEYTATFKKFFKVNKYIDYNSQYDGGLNNATEMPGGNIAVIMWGPEQRPSMTLKGGVIPMAENPPVVGFRMRAHFMDA